jgi:uncharacterized protein (DUF1499 family)
MTKLHWTLVIALAVVLLPLIAGQLGAWSGQAPSDLGVRDGRLAAPRPTSNNVHSQAALHGPAYLHAQIDPLPLRDGDATATMARLRGLVEATPGAQVVQARPDYLCVRYTTRWMRFVDDAEFWADPTGGVVQVRSASRVGRSDLGVNRARIEDLRRQLAAR